ncbi:MAG: hypothetical protein HRT99_03625 [Mycoplasmatales bacterium]|nr:hypothetical protein [Mycoplasmatales bacterium]
MSLIKQRLVLKRDIKKILEEEKKNEFVYKKKGYRFKEENEKLYYSFKFGKSDNEWSEFEDISEYGIMSLGKILGELKKIVKKNKKNK